ncbi:prevent-host-death protein [Chryseobacterium wangxinyae]|uniref:prevent-host-death protein n=1 Tax=Chryseobacterium sp. CY353 TaxID=2997334 RepID=UPI00226E6209|nr:prevent-host-death protein [Chryseobacterium sp. CY353]MCY0967983.1 prevent-host-death protein [Chryseobacterium sp. CY353]
MNYQLHLRTPDSNGNLVFNTIIFDAFKVNIVERYYGLVPKSCDVLFKVRTLDDQLIKRKDGHVKLRIKDEDYNTYKTLIKVFGTYEYKNKLISRNDAQQDFVHFILRLVIMNYNLN